MLQYRLPFFFLIGFVISTHSARGQTPDFTWVTQHALTTQFNPYLAGQALTVFDNGTFADAEPTGPLVTNGSFAFGPTMITRYNSNNEVVSSRLIDDSIHVFSLAFLNNGLLAIQGQYLHNLTIDGLTLGGNPQETHSFLALMESTGNVTYLLPGSSEPGIDTPIGMKVKNNNLYVCSQGYSNGQKAVIDIYNASFFLQVDTLIQTGNFYLSDFDVDSNNDIYLTGSCLGNASFNGDSIANDQFYNKFILKYGADYHVEWYHLYNDITCSMPSVSVSPNGQDIYMSDLLFSGFTIGNDSLEGPSWVYDFYVAKFNPQGEVQWAKELPNDALADASVGNGKFLSASDNGPYICGFYRKYLTWQSDTLLSSSDPVNSNSMFVLHLNDDGDAVFARGIQSQTGLTQANSINYVNGKILINGLFFGDCVFNDSFSFEALEEYRTFIASISDNTSGLDSPNLQTRLSVYPNPTENILRINSSEKLQNTPYAIRDITGKTIRRGTLIGSDQTISVPDLSPGIYLLAFPQKPGSPIKFIKR